MIILISGLAMRRSWDSNWNFVEADAMAKFKTRPSMKAPSCWTSRLQQRKPNTKKQRTPCSVIAVLARRWTKGRLDWKSQGAAQRTEQLINCNQWGFFYEGFTAFQYGVTENAAMVCKASRRLTTPSLAKLVVIAAFAVHTEHPAFWWPTWLFIQWTTAYSSLTYW